jgi:hypothetical protein
MCPAKRGQGCSYDARGMQATYAVERGSRPWELPEADVLASISADAVPRRATPLAYRLWKWN